jgi:flagellar hook-associated protein 1 FlgK
MGASPLMTLGMRAMAANYAALQVTGHNIANANVKGYSRQRAELATALGQFSGSGYFGKGSDVETVTRAHNAFLTREANTTTAVASMDKARLEELRQLETVFKTGEQGLGYAALQFLNSMGDLANAPGDTSSRQVVLARAQELAARFADAGTQLVTQQQQVREDLKVTVATVNAIAKSIAQVNQQIASVRGLGQPPNDLLDQRDQLINELSQHISVTTVAADDGSIGVFAGGGQRLVLSNEASELTVVDSLGDPSRAAIAIVEGGVAQRLTDTGIGGGRIAGLLNFQNDDLVQAQTLLGQMAAAIAGAVNAQQRLGITLHEPAGSVSPLDMFSVGAPHAQPMAGNAKDASGNFLASVTLTVTAANELQASEYALQADPSGTPGLYQLTRLSDGLVRSVADGDEVDGFRITLGSPAPSANDRFLLQPVTHAAANMSADLRDPRDIAAASPLTATVGGSNTGSLSIDALTVVSNTVDPQNTATINFTDDSGSYSWELRDRTTNALVASGTGTWVPGQTIPSDPDPDINGFKLTVAGVPRAGDSLTIEKTTNPAANNGNAVALAALRDQTIVGQQRLASGGVVGGATASDAYAAAMADIGVRVQGSQAISDISGALADQAEETRSSDAGVNLDEEAARLIEFQQSYQAAAKVLQVAQQIFETLLQTATG